MFAVVRSQRTVFVTDAPLGSALKASDFVLKNCSTLFYQTVLYPRITRGCSSKVLQKPIVSESFHKVLWKHIVITIRRRGGEAQVCRLPISVVFKKTVADT